MLMTRKRNRRHWLLHYALLCYFERSRSNSNPPVRKRQMWPVLEFNMIGVDLKELNSSFRVQVHGSISFWEI